MEVHAELATKSKMFCRCQVAFGGEPNTRTCPVCLGLPGAMPVPNRAAIEMVIKTALALNCKIAMNSIFHRKNYFYPDLPKGYQVSQYGEENPIGYHGYLEIPAAGGGTKRIGIRRVHLEEDTGKLMHLPSGGSGVDYNRAGTPLMEIVTDFPPDIHSADEARAYLMKLRAILTTIGVCDGKMEEGSLRCEPNVSVRIKGSDVFNTKSEIKNLNSFRAVQRGIEYEAERQSAALERGETLLQETRGWSDAKQQTFSQRVKEVEQEYRYFPEPDLVPLHITPEWIESIRATLPELPDIRRNRFMEQYGLPAYDAAFLTDTRALADYFEEAAQLSGDAKTAANWIMGDLARLLNTNGKEIGESTISAADLARMVQLIADGTISGKIAKTLLEEMYATGREPGMIVEEKGWKTIKDSGAVQALVDKVFADNPDIVSAIKVQGLTQKRGFLVGQVMKAAQGKADPQEVNRLIDAKLNE